MVARPRRRCLRSYGVMFEIFIATVGWDERWGGMFVYVLQSLQDSSRFYTGKSREPHERLKEHNRGKCRYTSGFRPWKLIVHMWFESDSKADAFERYLKSGSGRAFAKQHGHVEFSALTHFALQNKLPRHAFCQGQNACWRRGKSKILYKILLLCCFTGIDPF